MIGDKYTKFSATGAAASVGLKLMKTGQTTSYRTGDDGDLEAGRATSFTVLASNNPFGNTNRFTDELGGQTFTNNWVIDWSTYDNVTVLGYFRTVQNIATWNAAIDNSLGTFGTFANCRLTNLIEFINICRIENFTTSMLNYSPLNINLAANMWTSSTVKTNTTQASMIINQSSFNCFSFAKTNNANYIVCRTFTVTGTTLT